MPNRDHHHNRSKSQDRKQGDMPPPVGGDKNGCKQRSQRSSQVPPTWNNDCANPRFPPDASEVNREASGWKTDEPIPTNATEQRTNGSVLAKAKLNNPTSVKLIPVGKRPCRGPFVKKKVQSTADIRMQPTGRQALSTRSGQSSTLNLP